MNISDLIMAVMPITSKIIIENHILTCYRYLMARANKARSNQNYTIFNKNKKGRT
jgi:hypothetical protein